jgi:hypothetical protein
MTKDASIWSFLARLAAAGDPAQWQVIDHWDGDLKAVGIARADSAQPLVYVSTWSQHAGLYAYECETAAPPGSELPYIAARQGERADFFHLLSVLREHLGIDLNERA